MLYESYKTKLAKINDFLKILRRFRILILSLLAFVVALLIVIFSVYGIVHDNGFTSQDWTYGETLEYDASAAMTSVRFEYVPQGGDEWTDGLPVQAGSYTVRSYARNIFGGKRYGEEHTINIYPRAVELTIAGDTLVYGDMPVLTGDLVRGDRAECTQISYADITAFETEISVDASAIRFYTADGTDVTASYTFGAVSRSVEVLPRDITVVVSDAEKVYDATPLRSEEYTVGEAVPLAAGDQLQLDFKSSLTSVGSIENAVSGMKIMHEGEQGRVDITDHYTVNMVSGTLTVTPRPIKVTTSSAKKVYDGTPLNATSITVENLVSGQRAQASGMTEITDVGSAKNVPSKLIVRSGSTDVSKNYTVEYVYGVLTVTPRAITVRSASAEKVYDGKALSKTDDLGTVNLASGHSVRVTESAKITEVGEVRNTLTVSVRASGNTDVTKNYVIEYEFGTLKVTPRPITVTTGSAKKVYDGTPLSKTDGFIDDNLVSGHSIRAIGSVQITDVGTVDNALQVAIRNGDTDVTKNYTVKVLSGTLTVTPRPVIVQADSAEKEWDGTALTCDKFTVAPGGGLAWALVDGHTASGKISGSIVTVGSVANVISGVEIVDAAGKSVLRNYSVETMDGTLTINKRRITVTAGSAEKVYDATPLTEDGYTISWALPAFLKVEAVTAGSQTTVGESENVIDSIRITENGTLVNDTYFLITFRSGTLTVTHRPVSLQTGTRSWVYDGKEHYSEEYSILPFTAGGANMPAQGSDYGIVAGQNVRVVAHAVIQNVGTAKNELTVSISDSGNEDVTSNYSITYIFGELTVTRRLVSLQTGAQSWVYDGSEHFFESFTQVPFALGGENMPAQASDYGIVSDHRGVVVRHTVIQNVGTAQNVLVISIRDASDADVTDNYSITYYYQQLEVTPRTITVITASAEKVYDGTPLIKTDDLTVQNLLPEHSLRAVDPAQVTNVAEGEVFNTMTFTVWNGDIEVTANYIIQYLGYGTLKVTPRPIIVQADSAEKEWDGTALTCNSFTVLPGEGLPWALVGGHRVQANVSGSIVDVGTVPNVIDGNVQIVGADGNSVLSNYLVSKADGTLTVHKRRLTVTAGSAQKVYDGTPLTNGEFFVSWQLPDGFTIMADVTGSQTNAGDGVNQVGNVQIYRDGEVGAVTDKYFEITLQEGTLTVLPRTVVIETGGGKWVYDGQEHDNRDEYRVLPFEPGGEDMPDREEDCGLLPGHRTGVAGYTYIVDVGTENNLLLIGVYNEADEVLSANYDIFYRFGQLVVTPRPVTVITATASWIYTGEEFSDATFTVAQESQYNFLPGHSVKATYYTKIRDIGTVKNILELAVSEGTTDKTANYEIIYRYGTLSVVRDPDEIDRVSFLISPYSMQKTRGWNTARTITPSADCPMDGGWNTASQGSG